MNFFPKLISLALPFLFFSFGSAEAQQTKKLPRLGFLQPGVFPAAYREEFRKGLRQLGYEEGGNILVEYRLAKSLQELPSRVAELVGLKVDVIVTWTTPGTLAAKQGTTTIPIVMSGTGADPVAAGFVSSLERPGGNITGLSMLSTELSGKRLELLKETVPNLGRVAVLRNPKFPAVAIQSKETEEAAKSLGLSSKPGKCATRRKLTAPLLL